MLKWIRKLLIGPPMTPEERKEAVMCYEALHGKVFKLDGAAAEQIIRDHGFPQRPSDGPQLPN